MAFGLVRSVLPGEYAGVWHGAADGHLECWPYTGYNIRYISHMHTIMITIHTSMCTNLVVKGDIQDKLLKFTG